MFQILVHKHLPLVTFHKTELQHPPLEISSWGHSIVLACFWNIFIVQGFKRLDYDPKELFSTPWIVTAIFYLRVLFREILKVQVGGDTKVDMKDRTWAQVVKELTAVPGGANI